MSTSGDSVSGAFSPHSGGCSAAESNARLEQFLAGTHVLPVLSVLCVEAALEVSRALQEGGINAVEITLRTEAGLAAISEVKRQFPNLIVAAGTVTSLQQMDAVKNAGADFAVSPGMTVNLIESARKLSLPLLPGVSTASEVMIGMEEGLRFFKLFPAVAVGGKELLRSLAEPLAEARFCPTGGLTIDNFAEFLQLPNVVCVGGSWLVSAEQQKNRDWQSITEMARETCARL